MAALRSTRFYSGNLTSTSYSTLYTVPTGKVIKIHSIVLQNLSGSPQLGALVKVAGIIVLVRVLTVYGSQENANYVWLPELVANAGDTIQAALSAAGSVDIVVSGSLLYV